MTREADGPGQRLPGPSEDDAPATASVAVIVTGRTADPGELAAQLRRRRSAGWRLPPLEDGRRDPLDALAGLPARRVHRCAGVEFTAAGVRPCCRRAA